MPTPIIVPVQRTRECIVVEGKKFCESSDMSGGPLAIMGALFLLWLCTIALSFRAVRWNWPTWVFILMLVWPLPVLAIVMIVAGLSS